MESRFYSQFFRLYLSKPNPNPNHSSVLCSLNTTRPRHETKEICYRRLKATDFDALRLDLEESDLCSSVYRDPDN